MKNLLKDKKGASMSAWAEGIVASIIIVMCMTIIFADFNLRYNKNYDLGFNTQQINNSMNKFLTYTNHSQQQIQGGEVNFNSASGVTLLTSWSMVTDFFSVTWDFLMGTWIYTVVGALGLGPAGNILAIFLQALYIFSLVAIALYLLFRVMP